MATDNWHAPDADKAEQAAAVTEEEDESQALEPNEANEADVAEQSRSVPVDEEYRQE